MKKLRLLLVVIMSLMVLLPSSSFFLPAYLTQLITEKKHNQTQLSYAINHGNIAALNYSVEQEAEGSKEWQVLVTKLAQSKGEAAYHLANWYVKSLSSTKESAETNVIQNKAKMWFKQAVRLGPSTVRRKAQLALAQLYFEQDNLLAAQKIVKQLAENLTKTNVETFSNEVIILEIRIAIALGKIEKVDKRLIESQYSLLKTVEGRLLVNNIKKFNIHTPTISSNKIINNKHPEQANKTNCASSLQLFATNLKNLAQLEQLQLRFTHNPLARYICLAQPRYLPKTMLECNTRSGEAIQCNESAWQDIAASVESRHIGLMVDEGGANVHLGVMYIDRQDTIDVFSHEISHLLGFVDEYALVRSHDKCQRVQNQPFAHNIVVLNNIYHGEQAKLRRQLLNNIPWAKQINKQTAILQKVLGEQHTWRLGTPKNSEDAIGVYIAESCDNSLLSHKMNFSAFKPTTRRTQLRYFSSRFPKAYLTSLNDQTSRFLMPSFHYNIALALYQQGAITKAQYWLEQAVLWESTPRRREVIRQGAY